MIYQNETFLHASGNRPIRKAIARSSNGSFHITQLLLQLFQSLTHIDEPF